ncbi:OLC1v1034708C1 [Oldenlandia corymbosa var. corymbosa]|uniref:OLC1v1034708C1 n=1 Tax=Oldenlandia corymbosa var. corymbosa TaxID=529605 RepID=A0AAV1CSH7_OLDCO|nr:OLC1v1034708C1 [Oldenlandia corymbosa var. corymbosa]
MEWEWLREFCKGMIKPLLALSVAVMGMVLAHWQKLGLVGDTAYSVLRGLIQISAIGFVLHFLFHQQSSLWIVGYYLFMVCVAGYTAGQRAKHVPRGKYVAGMSILAGTSVPLSILITLKTVSFTPRYIIPLSGLIVGTAMNVTGITMKRLRDDIKLQTVLVETALALGATPRQATMLQVKRSVIIALSPALDNAKTLGLVTFPGGMTGMMLAGASPTEAIKLQLVIMNLIIGASTLSSITSTYLSRPCLFTEAHQLQTNAFISD